MAIISHSHQFVLLHIEKTAGCSMRKWLEGHYEDSTEQHMSIQDVQASGRWCPGYTWIGFVRNPYDRLVSWYEMECRDGGHETFEEFLEKKRGVIKPQWTFFQQALPVRVEVGSFECLETSFRRLVALRIHEPETGLLPVENVSRGLNNKHYSEYYTVKAREIADPLCLDDCNSFGYAF